MKNIRKNFAAIIFFFTCCVCISESFRLFTGRTKIITKLKESPQKADWVLGEDGSFSDKTDVSDMLNDILKSISKRSLSASDSSGSTNFADIDEKVLQIEFDRILSDIRLSSSISEQSKNKVILEINMALMDVMSSGEISPLKVKYPLLDATYPKTQIFYAKDAPYVIIYGAGPISKEVLSVMQSFGKAVQFRTIDGSNLSVMQDSELKFLLRDANTIIIAADNITPEKKGWFGSAEELPEIINEKGLKRLLNTAMKVRDSRGSSGSNIKIVSLGKASKPSRGVAAFLGGAVSDFDSDIVLQCQQRGLPYLVVKTGETVPNDAVILADDPSLRTADGPVLLRIGTPSSAANSGKTRVSTAAEALLRSVGHPTAGNCTITVLSTANNTPPTDIDWDSEFVKTAGPELLRIRLINASPAQAVSKVTRIAQGFLDRQSGASSSSVSILDPRAPPLVTPIEPSRFANGVRIVFRPVESGYLSSKEERKKESSEAEAEATAAAVVVGKGVKRTGYISPEDEAKAEAALSRLPLTGVGAEAGAKIKRKPRPEGGLEVIVDASPVPRVRIRRCEMGPQTVVKEESEGVLLRAFAKGLEVLENDYTVLIDRLSLS